MIKAIFFDIDGTLLDHEFSQRHAVKDFYRKYIKGDGEGLDRFLSVWRMVGKKYFDLYADGKVTLDEHRRRRIDEVFSEYGMDTCGMDLLEIFEEYISFYRGYWKAYPDAIPALEAIHGRYVLGIVSNGHSKEQRDKLLRTGMDGFFDHVVVSEDLGIAKPDPAIFNAALSMAGVRPHEAAHVGDDIKADIEGARNARLLDIYIDRTSSGYGGATIRVASLEDIPSRL